MKLSITFVPAEREKVLELISAVKSIFQIRRFKEPTPKDEYCHIYMNTSQR